MRAAEGVPQNAGDGSGKTQSVALSRKSHKGLGIMLSFDLASYKFQLRAAAVILHDGWVLLHRAEGDDFWALPGGRVEPGEDSASAVVREMHEELQETVVCRNLLYVVENFFSLKGKPNHEIGLYFAASLASESCVLGKGQSYFGVEGNSKLEFRWISQSELHSLDLRPSCLKNSLSTPVLLFERIVQRE